MKAISKGWIALGVIVLVVFMFYGFIKGNYNNFVVSEIQVEESWSNVESQYQRRFDLVPNLVASTKSVMVQEREVFGAIADARTRYAGAPSGSNEQVEATGQYESALGRLLLVMENYPVLLSSQSVRDLMFELSGTENRVNIARDRYNEKVGSFNKLVSVFPQNMLANMFDFDEKIFFESEEGSEDVVDVDLEIEENSVDVSASVE